MAIRVVYKTGLQGPAGPVGPSGVAVHFNWATADGYIKSVTHNLNSYALSYSFVDLNDGSVIEIDDTKMLSSNVVQFTSTDLPGPAGWLIIIRQ